MTDKTNVGTDNQAPEIIKPYPVNKTSFKVQDIFTDDDVKHTLTAEFKRLDSSNLRLLLNKEKDTERVTETLTKNRERERLDVDDAHNNFFNGLVIRGWLKTDDEEIELDYPTICNLNIEQKTALNVKLLDCKSKVTKVTGAEKYAFLFNSDGHMIMEFLIGDPENPVWTLLLRFKKPKGKNRSKFRSGFAYGETNRGGDLPITKTIINISEGVRFFDEYFDTVLNDPNYSAVHFLKEGTNELDHAYVEGDENDRKQFLQFFNPHFKVDNSGAIVAKFTKSSRES